DRRMLKLQEFFEQLQCPIRRVLNLVYNCREVGNFQFFLLASSDAKQVTFQFSMSTPTRQSISSILTTDEIREQFPSLERQHNGYPVAYFDGAGGTQTPRVVVDAVADYLVHHNANTHWEYPTSHETDAIIERARYAFADFLNAAVSEIVFGPNTTTMIYHLSRALGRMLSPGDEIVTTELEHHANIAPWQALVVERGANLNLARMDPESGQLDWHDFERLVTNKTKVV